MFLKLNSVVKIANATMYRVNEINIVKSAKLLENTAVIKLPRTAKLVGIGNVTTPTFTDTYFKVGDEVRISLGYNGSRDQNYTDGTLTEEFRGYVKRIKTGIPVEVECEDQTYILRKKNLKASFKKTTLKKLIEYILAGTGIDYDKNVPGIEFDKFYFRDVNAAYALQKLKEEYGLTIYFKDWNKLFVGLAFENDNRKLIYEMGQNVVNDNLEYVTDTDVKLRCKAILLKKNNTRIEKEVGDKDGDLRTLFFYNINEASLETVAKEELQKYKYTGYRGDFESFLIPNPLLGMICELRDPNYKDRSGLYLMDKIETKYCDDGARRRIFLGLKIGKNVG